MKTIKTLLFLLTVIGLTACKQVSITAPANNFVDDEKPAAFSLTFTGGMPTDLKIQLNTAMVTDRFAVTDTGATALGTDLADKIYSGRNIFRVSANKTVKQIAFYYDTEGPTIRILDNDKDTLTVTGYVIDKGGIASVSLDGVAVTLDAKNAFTTSYNDQSVNTFVASDNFGHTSQTQFARGDNEFIGISARLNQGGLDFLTAALREELLKADFTAILSGIAPISLVDFSPLGIKLFDIQFGVKKLAFDDIAIDLPVKDDERIAATLDTENFQLGLQASGHIALIPWSSKVNVQMNNVHLTSNILLDIVNTDLDLALSNTLVQNSYINVDFENVPGFLDSITSLMVNAIAGLLKPLFIDILEQIIIPIASDFIKDIPIQLQLVTLDDGETLNIKALPQFLDTANHGITVDLGTRIWAPSPAQGVPGALGSLYSPGSTPTMGYLDPDGVPFDFGASISSNVINQALFAAHEAGVTTMEIRPEIYPNATPEGIQVYAAGSEFGEGAKIGMRIEPASAPYIKFMPSADGAPGKFGWSDVYLAFDLYKPEWGEYRTLFGVTFDLEVPFEINTTDDGFLSIGIEQLPTIFISKTDSGGLILIPPAFINGTLDYFMPVVMPVLAEKLKVVPLPRIYNHTLHMNKFWIAGTGNNNLSLSGDLIPIAVTEAAPAPTTMVDYQTQDITVKQETVGSTGLVTSTSVSINAGEVTIDVDGVNPNPGLGLLEHRYRLDGGGWTVWKHRETIHLSRLLAGDHAVEICARTVLLKREQGCPVVTFTTTVN